MALAYQWLPTIDVSTFTSSFPAPGTSGIANSYCTFNAGNKWIDLTYNAFDFTVGSTATSVISSGNIVAADASFQAVRIQGSPTNTIETYDTSAGGTFGAALSTSSIAPYTAGKIDGTFRFSPNFETLIVSANNEQLDIYEGTIAGGYTLATHSISAVYGTSAFNTENTAYFSEDGLTVATMDYLSGDGLSQGLAFRKITGTWTLLYQDFGEFFNPGHPSIATPDGSITAHADNGAANDALRVYKEVDGWTSAIYSNSSHSAAGFGKFYILAGSADDIALRSFNGNSGPSGNNRGGCDIVFLDGVTPYETIEGDTNSQNLGADGVIGPIPTPDGEVYLFSAGSGTIRPLILTDYPTGGAPPEADFWTNFQSAYER